MRVLSLSKAVNMLFIAPGDSLLRREAGHHDAEENSSSFAAGKGFSLSLLLNTPFEVSRFGQLFEKFFFFFTAFFLHSVILKNSQMTETEGHGSEGKTAALCDLSMQYCGR